MKKIIDVSYHQGNIDFTKVKADGVEAVIIRAGYGAGTIDKKFKEYIEACKKVGLSVGIYWFSYAYSVGMAANEAKACIAAIKSYDISLPVFFDWEYDSLRYAKEHGVNPGKNLVTQMVLAFCEAIAAAGYKAGYYFNEDYRKNFIDETKLARYYTWYARYTNVEQKGYDIWQYSSKGRINGISGNVDLDWVINDKVFGIVEKKSNDEIAAEVIAGKWGSGADRKKKLIAAGYNYDAIQKIVNSKLEAPAAPKKKSNEEIAKEVIAGKWGSSPVRKKKLEAAGYNYTEIQKIVNKLMKK